MQWGMLLPSPGLVALIALAIGPCCLPMRIDGDVSYMELIPQVVTASYGSSIQRRGSCFVVNYLKDIAITRRYCNLHKEGEALLKPGG